MKTTNWQLIASQARELFPTVVQIASYSRNRWLLVFDEEPDSFLHTFHPLSKVIEKHKLTIPLIVCKRFIESSLDSYPLEFLDIQNDYTNLYASEDVLANLSFDKNDIRLQIERELKSKWLLTRLTALQYKKRSKHLFDVLQESFQALIPVFKGFCFLSGKTVSKETDKLLDSLEEIFHTDLKVFRYLAGQKKAPSVILVHSLFNDYIRLLNLCSEKIDEWKLA